MTALDTKVIDHVVQLIKLVRYKENQRDSSPGPGRIADINAITWACGVLNERYPDEFRVAMEMAGVPRCWSGR